MNALSAQDRDLILATQAGLPLCAEPFAAVAMTMGTSEQDVLSRFQTLIGSGVIRRIAAAPNHYKLGMIANGMSVWDVDDAAVDKLGQIIGELDFVSHCYRRPRALPLWPYNLFAMLHGTSRAEVEDKRTQVAQILGSACRASDILYSKRILKKTGVRLSKRGD
ncbi:MAG: Lrp/AsnC family transcriptional regulator [Hyphomicrobium sp.]|nr:Lrp/AsnC family transcriptional regulator [Hyphomicrobium sp.]